MRKIILLLAVVGLLSGCALSLPPNFVERAQTDLSTKPLLHQRADWLKGVFGYQGMFLTRQRPNIIRGALVCDEETLMFVILDKTLDKYISVLNLKFKDDFKNVSIGKFGAGRRLIVYGKLDVYTFEIIKKGALIDRVAIYEFAIFISDKIGQSADPFVAEFKKEKEAKKDSDESSQPNSSSDTGWGGK